MGLIIGSNIGGNEIWRNRIRRNESKPFYKSIYSYEGVTNDNDCFSYIFDQIVTEYLNYI